MKTEVTLKINSVVMDYLKDISESNNSTIEENIERYIKEVLCVYNKLLEE